MEKHVFPKGVTTKECKACGDEFVPFNTLNKYCGNCAYTFQKPMKKMGKVTKKWLKTRDEWIGDNPPDHAGFYICYLCGQSVHESEMELDHIKSRTRRVDLRFTQDNLAPVHHLCNTKKGSKNAENFVI